MASSVSVKGLAETRAALVKLGLEIRAAAEAATDEGAEAMYDDMRSRVPVDEGTTQGEIEVRDGEQDGTKEVGLFESDHGPYVEFGTENTPAQPFVLPSGEAERQAFPDRVASRVKGAVG